MNYPFPKIRNPRETAHAHKNIKELVLNVTENTSKKLTGKRTRVKYQANQEQEPPRAKSSPIKVPKKSRHHTEDPIKFSTKVS